MFRTNCSWRIGRISSSPRAHLDEAGCLRILSLGVLFLQCTNGIAINLPENPVTIPIDSISLERLMVPGIWVKGTTVISSGIAFSKVVRLNLSVVSTQPLPINLIQTV